MRVINYWLWTFSFLGLLLYVHSIAYGLRTATGGDGSAQRERGVGSVETASARQRNITVSGCKLCRHYDEWNRLGH